MSLAVEAVSAVDGIHRVGVNVLRNDAATALGIAAATGARFVRINVHTGAMVTDQGVIEGRAAETLRERARLGLDHVRVFADVHVKHATPFAGERLEDAARMRRSEAARADSWSPGRLARPDAARVETVRGAVGAAVADPPRFRPRSSQRFRAHDGRGRCLRRDLREGRRGRRRGRRSRARGCAAPGLRLRGAPLPAVGNSRPAIPWGPRGGVRRGGPQAARPITGR